MKDGDESPSVRQVEPYTIERELPVWRVHTWDLSVDAARTFRLDRMRSAHLTGDRFEARDGFDPSYLRDPRVARLLHSPEVARWKLERGARPLTDGSAIADVPYKTEEWLLSEVLADRGETSCSSHSDFVTSSRRGHDGYSATSVAFRAGADRHLGVKDPRRLRLRGGFASLAALPLSGQPTGECEHAIDTARTSTLECVDPRDRPRGRCRHRRGDLVRRR